MDLLRGVTSNSLETAKSVLDRKSKEHEDTFRAHSTRDVDDQLENLLVQVISAAAKTRDAAAAAAAPTTAKSSPILVDTRSWQIFMVLAGERAGRLTKSADEMDSKVGQKFAEALEKFMLMQPANKSGGGNNSSTSSKPPATNAPTADAASNSSSPQQQQKDNNRRPDAVDTPFDGDSSVAIAHRAFAVAVRCYAEWGLRHLLRGTAPAQLARRAIFHLDACIDNWRPSRGHLTPAHAALAEVCVKTHNSFSALARLRDPIFEIEPNFTGVTIFDYLDYYYFGGLCYASLEQYSESANFFSQVLQAPAKGLSVRCIQAAKLHLLVTCIETGEGSYPQSMRFGRHISELTRDYMTFTETLFKSIGSKNYDASASYNYPTDAKGEGLDQLCILAIRAVPNHRAQKMTLTYKTVMLSGIAKECGSDENFAMARLHAMVQNKTLSCSVDRQKGVVTFNEDVGAGVQADEDAQKRRQQEEVNDALHRVMEVNRAIQHRQDMALVSPGLVIHMTPQLPIQLDQMRKEMDSEKGGILGAMMGRR